MINTDQNIHKYFSVKYIQINAIFLSILFYTFFSNVSDKYNIVIIKLTTTQ